MIEVTTGQALIIAVIGVVGSITVAMIGFFGGRGTIQAQLQEQLNKSFHSFTDQLQEERGQDRLRIGQLEAELRGLEQHMQSLESLLRRAGFDIPPRPVVKAVFILDTNDGRADGELH